MVIQLKITAPALDSSVADRPRVRALVGRLVEQHRVVCIAATAGAGKTTAVLQTTAHLRRPTGWLSLDGTDVHPGRLLIYLEAAIARIVPEVDGVAAAALAAQLPHTEVAGLLAEAVGESGLLLVVDNAEAIAEAPEALAVISSFCRYLPRSARLVLVSRTVLALDPSSGATYVTYVAAVGEEDLAFTVDEARAALEQSGRTDVDPAEAIDRTGGWVTGVLFEAWRAEDHVAGLGGEADPLHGYLATQILGLLGPEDREFLITTSLLEEVTVEHARRIGAVDAAARMASLALVRIPAAWDGLRQSLRCHPRFREYLLELFSRRSYDETRAARVAHGRLLVELNRAEEAVPVFLDVGLLDEACAAAEEVVVDVVERTDFALAARWLAELGGRRRGAWPGLVTAELMLAVVQEDYRRGAELTGELLADADHCDLARRSSRIAGLMAWCHLHAGRLDEMKSVLAIGPPGAELDVVRYTMGLLENSDAGSGDPPLTGGPFDALVMRTHYDRGRLSRVLDHPHASPWVAQAVAPWQVGALLATGRVEQGFELLQQLETSGRQGVWLEGVIGPKLMVELGERAVGWSRLLAGRARIEASGSEMFLMLSLLTEAELELRINGNTAAATALLDEVGHHEAGRRFAYIREQRSALLGSVLLAQGNDKDARVCLLEAVTSMREGRRILWLPAAAVYLAEAHWRLGEEEAADDAASTALWAAEHQGSNHGLLQALAEFPAVLSRRLDSEAGADSAWHELGRSLATLVHGPREVPGADVHVLEFGRCAVVLDGTEVVLKLRKSYELLVLLANGESGGVGRQELLEQLFDGRTDDAAAAYLRQAVLRLRRAVPDVLGTRAGTGFVALGDAIRVTTESGRLASLRREAASLRGEDRLRVLLQLLEIADRGEYLPGVTSDWAERRRRDLGSLVDDARNEAAEVAFAIGRLRQAGRLASQVLRTDPYRESMWRLQMRIADAFGDHDRVIGVFRQCEAAMSELGTRPAASTAALLRDLRR